MEIMTESMKFSDTDQIKDLIAWLKEQQPESELAKRLWEIGLLTGWRQRADGSFGPENFERSLLLYRMVAKVRPRRILEVGTGRGFGCLAMATSAEDHGLDTTIDTIDLHDPDMVREWPIRLHGKDEVGSYVPRRLWAEHFDKPVLERINHLTGDSTAVLHKLLREGRRYDMLFVDAGHDAYHAIADLSYSIAMLRPGSIGLLDDFAPVAPYGLGAVMALPHLKKYFQEVAVMATHGQVWPAKAISDYPHGMVLLSGSTDRHLHVDRKRLLWWRIFGRLMELSYSGRRAFPLVDSDR